MDKYLKENLKKLREKKTTYYDMINYCCNNLIEGYLTYEALSSNEYDFERYCGSYSRYYNADCEEITEEEYYNQEDDGAYQVEEEIFQFFIIDDEDARRLKDYTNELVIYNDDLNLYFLCVKHFGTAWSGMPANWKEIEEEEEEE